MKKRLITPNLADSTVTYLSYYDSQLGRITLTSSGEALTGLWFEQQRHPAKILTTRQEEKELPVFTTTKRWLDLYFAGKNPDFTPPLILQGTPFRQTVGKLLLTIPYGQTTTYGALAEQIARLYGLKKMSAQAVGGAVGYNPISIIVPCHRVIGANGSLTGYGGGIKRKVQLLQLEKVDMTHLFIPKKGTAL